jgi:putative LysE/RhtB family amino acid efflux pump
MGVLLILFLKCILIGVAMAAPLGPISMLLIKKTLENGMTAGAMIAIGAACADSLYCGIAGVALASVTTFIQQHQLVLRIVGKALMAGVLITECRFKPADHEPVTFGATDKLALCAKVFFLTLGNPVTILTLSGIFLAYRVEFSGYDQIIVAVLGVFIGSALWCFSLSGLTAFGKRYMSSGFVKGLQFFSLSILAALVLFI